MERQKEHQRLAEIWRNEQYILAEEDAKKDAIKYDVKEWIRIVKEKEREIMKRRIEDI